MLSTGWMAGITNHLWQTSLVVVVAWLLTLVLRRQQPKVRFALWMAASLKFLLPFSFLITLGTWLRPEAAPHATAAVIGSTIQQFTEPFAYGTELPAMSTHDVKGRSLADSSLVKSVLLLLWICGSLTLTLAWGMAWIRLRRKVRSARHVTFLGDIPVRSSPWLMEPGIFGIRHPVLILPDGILDKLSSAQMNAVFVHELRHVKRRDNLFSALHMLTQILFWFHPMVWWIEGRLIEEREFDCDEAVLQSATDAHTYAESILAVCRFYTDAPLVCTSGVSGGELKRRISRIMRPPLSLQLNLPRKALIACLGLLAIAIPVMHGVMGVRSSQARTREVEKLNFEVSSVKPHYGGVVNHEFDSYPRSNVSLSWGNELPPPGGMFRATNNQLISYLAFAFDLSGGQEFYLREHAPKWVKEERFDILARPSLPNPTKDEIRAMMRSLLAERFKLAVHEESVEMPVYALKLVRPNQLGPQLRRHREDDPVCKTHDEVKLDGAAKVEDFSDGYPAACNAVFYMRPSGTAVKPGGRGVSMTLLASVLPIMGDTGVNRPVIDKTGITGDVDFAMELPLVPGSLSEADRADTSVEFVTALRDQLGLRLERDKGPVSVIVIDHIERPSPN